MKNVWRRITDLAAQLPGKIEKQRTRKIRKVCVRDNSGDRLLRVTCTIYTNC